MEEQSRPRVAVAVALVVLALWALGVGIAAVWRFGWRDVFADAYRLYANYLSLEFPHSVLVAENGHRPVVANLLRYAELKLMAGDHRLQWLTGLGFAVASVLGAWRIVLRDARVDIVARAAAMLVVALAVFWLANARMLLHPAESVQTYLVVLALVAGAAFATRYLRTGRWQWLTGACGCAFVATFSFGTGFVSFAAFAVALFIARAPWIAIAGVLAAMLATLALYFALPGGATVSSVMGLDPWLNLQITAQLIASPIATLAAPPPGHTGPWLPRIAPRLVPMSELPSLATAIGLSAMAMLVVASVRRWRRGELGDTEVLALALGWFGMGAALLVGLARLGYFNLYPEQLFAARYLPWPCLMWAALALLGLSARAPAAASGLRPIVALVAIVAAVALLRNAEHARWGRMVQAHIRHQVSAIVADLWSTPRMQGETITTEVAQALPHLRAHRVAMFAHPAAHRLGTSLSEAPSKLAGGARDVKATPFRSDRGAAAVDVVAVLPDGYSPRAALWVVTDAWRVVVGYGHPSPLNARSTLALVARAPDDGVLLAFPWLGRGPGAGVRIDVATQ